MVNHSVIDIAKGKEQGKALAGEWPMQMCDRLVCHCVEKRVRKTGVRCKLDTNTGLSVNDLTSHGKRCMALESGMCRKTVEIETANPMYPRYTIWAVPGPASFEASTDRIYMSAKVHTYFCFVT